MRPLDEILRDAEAKGFTVDSSGLERGSDWITLLDTGKRHACVTLNVSNGRFICSQPGIGVAWATERSLEFEGIELYDELLELFYAPMDDGGAA